MAKIYGTESLYILNKKNLYSKRVIFLLVVTALIFFPYLFNIWSIIRAKRLIAIGIPALFIVIFGIIYYVMDIQGVGLLKARRGLQGEEDVFDILKKLPDEYSIFRGIQINGPWDIDFIIVGPTGVFTIETKSHKGTIEFNGEELTHNGTVFPEKNILKQSMSQAWNTHMYLQEEVNKDIFVKPVIVFTRAKAHFGLYPINNVYIIQKQWLENFILDSKDSLVDYEHVANSFMNMISKTNGI